MNNRKNTTRLERQQQKLDTGFMSEQFPGVESIVISMKYTQNGIRQPLLRTVNFFPGSYAFFRIECLSKDCIDGGFDFASVIRSMIRNRRKESKGDLVCAGNDLPAGHSSIIYEVAIKYR